MARFVATHGHTRGRKISPTYWSWLGMIGRCGYPKHPCFSHYGGKGVEVCQRWRTFSNFLADMGERPEGMTLDRLDSAKDYALGNCRWATRKEQARQNRRMAKFGGKVMSRAEIIAELGITHQTLLRWLRQGALVLEDV
jgi:hypothetical protein